MWASRPKFGSVTEREHAAHHLQNDLKLLFSVSPESYSSWLHLPPTAPPMASITMASTAAQQAGSAFQKESLLSLAPSTATRKGQQATTAVLTGEKTESQRRWKSLLNQGLSLAEPESAAKTVEEPPQSGAEPGAGLSVCVTPESISKALSHRAFLDTDSTQPVQPEASDIFSKTE